MPCICPHESSFTAAIGFLLAIASYACSDTTCTRGMHYHSPLGVGVWQHCNSACRDHPGERSYQRSSEPETYSRYTSVVTMGTEAGSIPGPAPREVAVCCWTLLHQA